MLAFRLRIKALAICAILALSACATVNPDGSYASLDILRKALNTPVEQLETQASQNNARAQYALGLVYQYGLQKTPKDPTKSGDLKRKATASRGYMPITQYIAGLNGKPGRTAIINVPKYDVSIFEAKINDGCAEALASAKGDEAGHKACQGSQLYKTLKGLWEASMMS